MLLVRALLRQFLEGTVRAVITLNFFCLVRFARAGLKTGISHVHT